MQDGVTDAAIETSYILERFHQQLAVDAPNLHITTLDDDRVEANLTLTVPSNPPGSTKIWLASLPGDVHGQPLGESLTWTIAPINVTPFIAVETTAGEGEGRVTRRCVLKATLSGAVDGRRHDAVFSILRSKEDVLRYLVFLLGDPSYDALFAQIAGVDGERFSPDMTPGFGDCRRRLVRAIGPSNRSRRGRARAGRKPGRGTPRRYRTATNLFPTASTNCGTSSGRSTRSDCR